ncbi:hypothetical protein GOV07_01140 [Candidatus Woesearchaeota archaeon]|nr:hypothetical protein [Candidatus Woesearchaeota archaeon]
MKKIISLALAASLTTMLACKEASPPPTQGIEEQVRNHELLPAKYGTGFKEGADGILRTRVFDNNNTYLGYLQFDSWCREEHRTGGNWRWSQENDCEGHPYTQKFFPDNGSEAHQFEYDL